ncbi:MAG: PAS domain-containing protein [Dehalococcoidia bacterium]
MTDSRKNKQPTDWAWVEVLPAPALVISAERIVLAINTAGEEEFGYTREELVGNPADFLIPDYVWPPAQEGGITLNLAAETASGSINPVDVFLGPANLEGVEAYIAMVEGVEYESEVTGTEPNFTVRELLSDIGRIVSSSLDIESVCEQFSMAVMRAVPTERVAIIANQNGSSVYEVIYAVPATTVDTEPTIKFEANALVDAFETHSPILVTETELEQIVTEDL